MLIDSKKLGKFIESRTQTFSVYVKGNRKLPKENILQPVKMM